jgi:hypothetical protein
VSCLKGIRLPASTPTVFTGCGLALLEVLPLPSCPDRLFPHAASVPSEQATTLKSKPAAIAVISFPAKYQEAESTGTALSMML